MLHQIVRSLALAAGAVVCLSGCQIFGPASIGSGRPNYNDVIQKTSSDQIFANIIRVHNYEPTLFMDVTEVDATLLVQGSLTGGMANIGGRATTPGGTLIGTGSASSTIEYEELPTIRYVPLLGQALVSQLVTPISVQALTLLTDSTWDPGPVLDMATEYLTPDHDHFYIALDTIEELYNNQSIQLSSAKSSLTKAKSNQQASQIVQPGKAGQAGQTGPIVNVNVNPSGAGSGTNSPTSSATDDTLVIYRLPFHPEKLGDESDKTKQSEDFNDEKRYIQLWARLLRIYEDTQPNRAALKNQPNQKNQPAERNQLVKPQIVGCPDLNLKKLDVNVDDMVKSESDFRTYSKCLPKWVELRAAPVPVEMENNDLASDLNSLAPTMRTFSSLGILKNVSQTPRPLAEFVTPDYYKQIVAHPWNKHDIDSLRYYTLLTSDENSTCPPDRMSNGGCDHPPQSQAQIGAFKTVNDWIKNWSPADTQNSNYSDGLTVYETKGVDVLSDRYVTLNEKLGNFRHYMLIVVDDNLPASNPPYVSYYDGSRWYYINADDEISKKNFHLLSLFLTVLAVPPQTSPLTPTISVGGS